MRLDSLLRLLLIVQASKERRHPKSHIVLWPTKEFKLEFPPLHSKAIVCTDLSSPGPLPYSDKLSAEGCGFSWFKSHLFVPVSELSS